MRIRPNEIYRKTLGKSSRKRVSLASSLFTVTPSILTAGHRNIMTKARSDKFKDAFYTADTALQSLLNGVNDVGGKIIVWNI